MSLLMVIIGVVAGVCAFLPLIGAVRAVRHVTSTSNLSHASILLLALTGSIAVLALATIACAVLADKATLVAFAGGEAGGLAVAAIVQGAWTFARTRNSRDRKGQ